MHTGSLGVLSWFCGAVLKDLVNSPTRRSRPEKLAGLWDRIQFWYHELECPSRFTHLPLPYFEPEEGALPCLKGKAAETQWLLYFLKEICVESQDGSPRSQHRARACENLADMYDTVKDGGSFLSEADSQTMFDRVECCLAP